MKTKLLQATLMVVFGSLIFVMSCNDDKEVDPPIASFTFSVNNETGVVTFTNTSTDGESYVWDFGDETASTEVSPTHTYTESDSYSVTLTATNEGGTDENTQIVTVELPAPVVDEEAPVITLTGDADIDVELGGTFTDPGFSANDNVDGEITDNVTVGGDAVDTQTAGTYVITYDVSDAAGNAATQVTRTVRVRYPGGLITNGDFQGSSTEPWFVNFGDGTVPTEAASTNTFFIVNIETPNANEPFVVNLSQVVEVENGKTYKLSFNSSSDVSRSFTTGIGVNGGASGTNFQAVVETISVTTTEDRYEAEFSISGFEADTDIRVLFDLAGEAGVVVLDNIALEEIDSPTPVPTTAPAAPTVDAADVTSLFSDTYTDVMVDTWSAEWDDASQEDVEVVAGNFIKKVTFGDVGGFLGVDFSSNAFDATAHTHFHMDYWIADEFAAGQVLNPKWSNHAAGVEVNAFEYTNAIGDTQSGTWVSLDVEISSFGGTTTRDNLAQFILTSAATLDIVYVDNIYLYTSSGGGSGGGSGGDTTPDSNPTAPTQAAADVISLFSDAYTSVTVSEWSTSWDDASVEDVMVDGNNMKKVTFGDVGGFWGVDFSANSFDATSFTHFHIDYWITDAFAAGQVLNPKWSNHAAGVEVNAFEYTNAIADGQSGMWISLDIAIADFNIGTSTRDNLAQFILAGAATIDEVYVDNIYLYK